MKNTLFTGIAGENPAVLLNREQALAIKVRHNHRDTSFEQRRWREISLLQLRRPLLPLQVYYFK